MITVTVDYNNDEVRIESDGSSRQPWHTQNVPIKIHPARAQQLIEALLYEIDAKDVTLVRIDEDRARIVEEW